MNLETIAQKAGVSRATVSRVINNHPYVSDEVRKRVLAVIEQEGFHPNGIARALAKQRTEVIGVIAPEGLGPIFTVPYFPELLSGISAAISETDYVMALWVGSTPQEVERMYRRILSYKMMDGALLLSAVENDSLPRMLLDRRMPVVMIGRSLYPEISTIDVDNFSAAQGATEHLIRLKRKRIAHLSGSLALISGRERQAGYETAMRNSALGFDPNLIIEGDYSEMGGYLAASHLVESGADAIFVASDTMAVGLVRGLREMDIQVPQQIAIVAFDDLPISATVKPSLTTVRQPVRELGAIAVRTLIDVIEGHVNTPQRIVLPTELVIRESCGMRQRRD